MYINKARGLASARFTAYNALVVLDHDISAAISFSIFSLGFNQVVPRPLHPDSLSQVNKNSVNYF